MRPQVLFSFASLVFRLGISFGKIDLIMMILHTILSIFLLLICHLAFASTVTFDELNTGSLGTTYNSSEAPVKFQAPGGNLRIMDSSYGSDMCASGIRCLGVAGGNLSAFLDVYVPVNTSKIIFSYNQNTSGLSVFETYDQQGLMASGTRIISSSWLVNGWQQIEIDSSKSFSILEVGIIKEGPPWDSAVRFSVDTFIVPSLVPVPAAAWLFGSGLGLLALTSRKTHKNKRVFYCA